MRFHLFEFEDLSWFPDTIRKGGTDYLRYFLNAVDFYKPAVPLIYQVMEELNEHRIIDLCSGGGGAIEQITLGLNKVLDKNISITLTDKFPNNKTYLHLKEKYKGQIDYIDHSIDAADVPKNLPGVRTIFSAIHHIKPQKVKSILKNAVDNNAAICIFDGGDKNIFTIFGIILFHPIAFLLFTPFFRPFKVSRLFFTYIIPLIPLMTVWDGVVSILRLYTPEDLILLSNELGDNHFTWKAGKVKNKLGMSVTYLIGLPKG